MATQMHILAAAASVPVAIFENSKGKGQMMNLMKRLWKEEQGQDLIEYALLVALVALAATVGMNALATKINLEFTNLGTSLTTAT
jgi:pilus assembly protein Flp/PilA